MLNSLFITRGKDSGKSFTVTGSTLTIGRDRGNSIRLADEEVSRLHCLVEVVDGEPYLVDKSSSNGTFLNGKLIKRERIKQGDLIRVGKTQFVFDRFLQISIDPLDAGPKTAAPTKFPLSRSSDQTKFIDPAKVETDQLNGDFGSNAVSLKLDTDLDSSYEKLAISKGEIEAEKQYVQLKDDLKFVYRASLATARSLDTPKMFQELIRLIFEWVDADRGCVLLRNKETGKFNLSHLETRKDSGFSNDVKRESVSTTRIHKKVIDYVIEAKVGVLSPTSENEVRDKLDHRSRPIAISEVLCVPIEGRNGELLGVLYVDRLAAKSAEMESRFNTDHLRLMFAMANQAAAAIENEAYYRVLIEQERLLAIGDFTSLMSHRINNILQGLAGGSHLIQAGFDRNDLDLCKTGWNITHKNQDQISQLVKDLLVLSNPFDPHNTECRLVDVVKGTITAMEAELAQWRVDCRLIEGPGDDCVMHADANYIKPALMNLIRVSAQAASAAESTAPVEISLESDSDFVDIVIVHQGRTIVRNEGRHQDKEPAESIDDEVFRVGKFELSVTEKIVRGYAGALEIEETANGNRVRIRFPLAKTGLQKSESVR